MSFTHVEQLPFVGMSYEFVGEKQGGPFSAYVVMAKPREGSNAKTSVTPIRPPQFIRSIRDAIPNKGGSAT